LELVLSDEVERRDHKNLTNRLQDAGFEEECTLERFDWSAKIGIDKARLTELFGLHFIERHENAIFCGLVGVGKSFWAQALGHAACRAGYRVLFIRSDRQRGTPRIGRLEVGGNSPCVFLQESDRGEYLRAPRLLRRRIRGRRSWLAKPRKSGTKEVESVSGAEGPAFRAGQPNPEPEESSRRMQTGTEFDGGAPQCTSHLQEWVFPTDIWT
jgi:hypothetical protein